jgi:transcriptional regulator with XRE-family HTH domain
MAQAATAPESGDPPAYDLVYQKVIKEQLHTLAPDAVFAQGLAKRFRQAPMAVCSKAIGTWINRQLKRLGWKQQDLGDRLGIDRSAVAYWIRGGNIHLVNLAQVLIEFHCHWADLPIPPRQELALAAYLAALAYVQERVNPGGGKRLEREGFWALFHLFSEPHWERAVRQRDPDLLRGEAVRIVAAVEKSLGQAPRLYLSVSALQQLVSDWGVAWLVCIGQVPRKWGIR